MYNYYAGRYEPTETISKKYTCRMLTNEEEVAKCENRPYLPYLTEILAGPWI